VVAYQEIFFYGRWPDLSLWLIAVVYGIGGFVVGAMVFATYEHRFAEQV
jgi:ABC-type polysaccharide/polyol phosphate export permease